MGESMLKVAREPIPETAKRGKIKWFDTDLNYGFVSPAEIGKRDVFLHRSAVKASQVLFEHLVRDQDVYYVEEMDRNTHRISVAQIWLIGGDQ